MILKGIDIAQTRILGRTFLRMNFRGSVSHVYTQRSDGIPRGMFWTLLLYTFYGFFFGFVALFVKDVFTYSLILHGMTFFMVGMIATTESGNIFFNRQEADVLGHRPIHPRTLVLAKILDLTLFILLLAGALNLAPVFFALTMKDAWLWFPAVHAVSLLLASVFCVSSIVFVYGLIVRLFGRERFESMVTWSQVIISIFFMAGYQIIPRMLQRLNFKKIALDSLWLLPLPPAWFAGFDAAFAGRSFSPSLWLLAVIAVIGTFALGWAAIVRLASAYGETIPEFRPVSPSTSAEVRRSGIFARLFEPVLRLWMPDPLERAAFRLASAYMLRDRDTRLRLYPSLGWVVIYPFIMMMNDGNMSIGMGILAFAFLNMVSPTAVDLLRLSPNFQAADIFAIAPLRGTAPLFHGVRKATLTFLLLPAVCISVPLIWFLGDRDQNLLLLAIPSLLAIPTLSLTPGLFGSYLPLARPLKVGDQTAMNMVNFLKGMVIIAFYALLGFGSYWAWEKQFFLKFIIIEAICLLLLHSFLSYSIKTKPFKLAGGR